MRVWNKLVNWIYPPTCPLCGDVTGRQVGQVCDECRPMIDYPAQPVCMRCGCEITDEEVELCEDCTRHARTYIQGFPAMKYQYPLMRVWRGSSITISVIMQHSMQDRS